MTQIWKATFTLIGNEIDGIEHQLWDVFENLFIYHPDDQDARLSVEITYHGDQNKIGIEEKLKDICANANIPVPNISFSPVPDINWLKHVYDLRVPIEAGRFFIHGGHITDYPKDKVEILINAATAFGTGEHATTKGCLLALDDFLSNHPFKKVLDMGCGSGVLAIAAAKVLKHPILAVDCEEEAVHVTQKNADLNNVVPWVTAIHSQGFDNSDIHGSYDLILANILFAPLINMAGDIKKHMAENGILVLSGILQTQEERIRAVYEPLGFIMLETYPIEEWQTVVFKNDTAKN